MAIFQLPKQQNMTVIPTMKLHRSKVYKIKQHEAIKYYYKRHNYDNKDEKSDITVTPAGGSR